MFTRLFRRLSLPRSLRWQFMMALPAPVLLILTGGRTTIYDLRISSDTTRQLAEDRLVRLQQAQDPVQCTFLIERESHRMLTADSLGPMQASYLKILQRLDLLDLLVLRLGQASNDLAVVALNQADQLFRNTVHTVAQPRKNLLARNSAPPESARQQETLLQLHGKLQHQAVSLVDVTRDLSDHFTGNYQEAMQQLTAMSAQHQRQVLALVAGSRLRSCWGVSS